MSNPTDKESVACDRCDNQIGKDDKNFVIDRPDADCSEYVCKSCREEESVTALVIAARNYASMGDGVPKQAIRYIALLCETAERAFSTSQSDVMACLDCGSGNVQRMNFSSSPPAQGDGMRDALVKARMLLEEMYADQGIAHEKFNRLTTVRKIDVALASRPIPVSLHQEFLRKLVDHVWGVAHEDQSVPSTKWADEMIEAIRVANPVPQPGMTDEQADKILQEEFSKRWDVRTHEAMRPMIVTQAAIAAIKRAAAGDLPASQRQR